MSRALVFVLVVALTGCAGAHRRSHHPGRHAGHSGGKGGLVVALVRLGVVAVEAIVYAVANSVSSSSSSSHEDAPSYEPPSGWSPPAPATPAPTTTPADPDVARFDPGAAHRVLGEVDLSPCRDQGLAAGYVRASATFGPDGGVHTVWVDEPDGLSGPATACVTARIGRAEIPPYHGEPVTTRQTWYVRGE
jgi:hypothetical protein